MSGLLPLSCASVVLCCRVTPWNVSVPTVRYLTVPYRGLYGNVSAPDFVFWLSPSLVLSCHHVLPPNDAVGYGTRPQGELFRNHLKCYPVSSDEPGEISHIVGMLTAIPSENKNPCASSNLPAVKAF